MEKTYYRKRVRRLTIITGLSIALLFTVLFALMTGVMGPIGNGIPGIEKISFRAVFEILLGKGNWPDTYKTIILKIRLPRIILAGLVGSALAVAGCAMQGLFRNPMASPYILGASSGAAFGASLVIVLGLSIFGIYTMQLSAFIFAVLAVFVVYNIARWCMPVAFKLFSAILMSFSVSNSSLFLCGFLPIRTMSITIRGKVIFAV